MRFAYADPPYLGCSKYYDHPRAKIYDSVDGHEKLIKWLLRNFPDGWALSASSSSLQSILPLCPDKIRIGSWVKPFHVYKKGVRPAYSWEPVLYYGGRNPPAFKHPPPIKGGKSTTPKDHLACNITLKKGLVGAKPLVFCKWVIDLMGAINVDYVYDIFPGTEIMRQACEDLQVGYRPYYGRNK